jgi:hypothetical protein
VYYNFIIHTMLNVMRERITLREWLGHMLLFHANVEIRNDSVRTTLSCLRHAYAFRSTRIPYARKAPRARARLFTSLLRSTRGTVCARHHHT